ncbi:beta-galactosidase-1-like protein 2 [Tribolium castaneum]|uniref:beta-galactosidase-1-like protein 2 n=1 Tax=Tribolium castaneum TaxID=7070 RepID=UPI0030FE8274
MAVSLYEHYTSGGVTSGLSTNQSYFTLNSKNITLYSGALHYFRVPQQYWRDRLRKLRAAGLNTVETYVPWNLHEPQIGNYDFGDGGSDFSNFLHLEKFLKLTQEEDLLAIVRPGPYICAEWDFGGLPSWLLRENVKVRTSEPKFMSHVTRFFTRLLPILAALQFTKGGPIVAFQVENEYGSTEELGKFAPDKLYIKQLSDLMRKFGLVELLFTSDSPSQHGDRGTLPELFQTANFARDPGKEFQALGEYQKSRPTMAMEFWTGWFDHWGEGHNRRNNTEFSLVLNEILKYPASVNMYMFHGGTSFGFLNGANVPYQPDTTSYDYDAPLTENGNYTEKYHIVKNLITRQDGIKTKVPPLPDVIPTHWYPKLRIGQQLKYHDIIKQLEIAIVSEKVVPMELLPINNNSGQSYGYTIYRTTSDIPPNSTLKIEGYIHDSCLILVDDELISPQLNNSSDLDKFGYWRLKDGTIQLPQKPNATIDIIVENWGRINYGKLHQFKQFKGLNQNIFLNDQELKNWTIIPLEFKSNWINSLTGWGQHTRVNLTLNKAIFPVSDPEDTYLDMSDWNTGIVIVNGFVLGRFMHLGPQKTLYLPAPLLRKGNNEIVIFEHFIANTFVTFAKDPIYV